MKANSSIRCLAACLLLLVKSSAYAALGPLGAYNIDPAHVSVSGLSSGAWMAQQLGVAYSSRFIGVGVFAGGFYDCWRTTAAPAGCSYPQTPNPSLSIAHMNAWSGSLIDPVSNIARQKIYVFTGTNDTVIGPNVTDQVVNLYKNFTTASNIHYDNTLPAIHTFPTDFDAPGDSNCFMQTNTLISNCGFDGAGAVLQWIYGPLNPRNTGTLSGHLIQFDQSAFAPSGIGMDNEAWVYVPAGCASGQSCRLHIALHGCNMSYSQIGAKFLNNTGYNLWADTNNIIILYPQAIPDPSQPANYIGCWDFHDGYGLNYDQHGGVQIEAIMGMVAKITSGYSPAARPDLNQHGLTGSWYEAAESGQGIEVEVFSNPSSGTGSTFVSWFAYDTVSGGAERQRWYTAQGPVVTGQPNASLTIYQNSGGNFNAPPVTNAQVVGTATLTFDTCSSGQLAYSFTDGTGRTGTIPFTRLTQNVTCSTTSARPTNADFALSGNWYGGAATSGQGFTAEVNPNSSVFFSAWYTYMPNGTAAGLAGQRWYTAQGAFTPGMRSIPVTIYETTGGIFDKPTPPGQNTVAVGTGTMAFQSCSAATFSYNFTGGTSLGLSGTINLSRVGPVPPGCTS